MKLLVADALVSVVMSSPSRGTWIEIKQPANLSDGSLVVPLTGDVD